MMSKSNLFYILKHVLVMTSFALICTYFEDYFNYKGINNDLEEYFNKYFYLFIFYTIIIAPILEELAFRLPLKKNNYFFISILIIILFFLAAKLVILKFAFVVLIISILLNNFYSKNKTIFILNIIYSNLVFIALHLDNYELEELMKLKYYDYIFQFSSQIFISPILTKIRIETTVLNSIIAHSLYNLSILILVSLSY